MKAKWNLQLQSVSKTDMRRYKKFYFHLLFWQSTSLPKHTQKDSEKPYVFFHFSHSLAALLPTQATLSDADDSTSLQKV